MSGVSKTIANRIPPNKADLHIAGVVLAGGRSRRFNGAEKALQTLAGRSLIQRVIGRARPQVDELVISTNGDPSRFSEFANVVVVVDDMKGHQGPLAGLAACLSWLAEERPEIRWVATFPVDSPFFPGNFVASLSAEALPKGVPAFAASGGRMHPVFGLWPIGIEPELRRYLVKSKRSPLVDFIRSQDGIEVAFAPSSPDSFFNINTEEELTLAENMCRESERGV
jgi:molybdopterin-guanine dinucleotide biosynthesis protein A